MGGVAGVPSRRTPVAVQVVVGLFALWCWFVYRVWYAHGVEPPRPPTQASKISRSWATRS